ncbi:MAG: nucleoside-diphosphate kinase, partial [Peptococcaceae bacterium]|nr:nucleoside-diphosphate kinase [Peptococcaceae bacterium]
MERTYLMVKPDGVQRGVVGEIISRFEKKGLKIVGLKLLQITREIAERHYGEHKEK